MTTDPLATFRAMACTAAEAVRWACVLEATAPKAGNVYPGNPFDDLTHLDFLLAADIAAAALSDPSRPLGERILDGVHRTVQACGTNVNLGILLLLGPIVAADQSLGENSTGVEPAQWRPAIENVLQTIDSDDARDVFSAIAKSSAGGLGEVESMDVHQPQDRPIDLIAAMRQAAPRDRIARQYATRFADLIDHVLPVVRRSIFRCCDVLGGIAAAHLQLLATEIDSLIARKNGLSVADRVKRRAGEVVIDDPQSVARFDDFLRTDGHNLNPGTTADLIAAAVYLMLRTIPEDIDD